MSKFIKAAFISVTTLLSVVCGSFAQAAGTAHLSMSPASGSYTVGATFSVTISETSTDAINVVQPDLSYNQSLLQLTGFTCNAAVFEFSLPGSCGTATPKTGSRAVATASFKALAAGTAAVTFASSSHIYSAANADVWDGATAGGSFVITNPPVVVPTPPTGGGSSTGTTPTTTPKPTTNQPSSPTATGTTTPTPTTPVVAGATTQAATKFRVTVRVTDSKNNAVQNAKVTINSTVKTNKQGLASFSNVTAGKYDVVVARDGIKDVTQQVTITQQDQLITITVAAKKSHNWFIFGSVFLGTGLAALVYVNRNRVTQKLRLQFGQKPSETIV